MLGKPSIRLAHALADGGYFRHLRSCLRCSLVHEMPGAFRHPRWSCLIMRRLIHETAVRIGVGYTSRRIFLRAAP